MSDQRLSSLVQMDVMKVIRRKEVRIQLDGQPLEEPNPDFAVPMSAGWEINLGGVWH